jgi:hypothetical protein
MHVFSVKPARAYIPSYQVMRTTAAMDVLHAGVKRDPTKFSNSRNAGPQSPLDFSRGRAAFRCVSPIEGERPGP